MSRYKIVLFTGDVDNGGTDAEVFISLLGSYGTKEFILDNPGNDRERGNRDIYFIEAHDVGNLKQVRIRHDNSGDKPGWFLNKIDVINENTGKQWKFSYYNWLAIDEGDGKIVRYLNAI